jgi:hypothetical protein
MNKEQAKGIYVTEADIGRAVVYRRPYCKVEQGTITSFNDKYVFVRYGLGSTSAATDPSDLEWIS